MGERRVVELFAAAGGMGVSAYRFSGVAAFALLCTGCGAGYQNAPDDGGTRGDGSESDAIAATDGAVAVDVVDSDVVADTGKSDAADSEAVVDAGPSDAPNDSLSEGSPPQYPATCAVLTATSPTSPPDGSYTLYLGGDPAKPWTAYCHDGLEYLTLPTSSTNYSQFTAGGVAVGINVRTSYTRVRYVVDLGEVDISDQTFATSTGSIQITGVVAPVTSMLYGVAASCDGADSGIAMIDLTGTSFSVAPGQFLLGGAQATDSVTYSDDNRVVNIAGGGVCGWEGPGTLGGQGTVGGVQRALQYSP